MDQMNLEASPGISPYKLASSSGTKNRDMFEQGRTQNSVLMIEESLDNSNSKTPKNQRYKGKNSDTSTVFKPQY